MRIATFNLQNLRLRGDHLDGARDSDLPADMGDQAPTLDHSDRQLSAQVIRDTTADIIALQEVFDSATLDAFHDRYLTPIGVTYPHRHCLPGNDGRGLDVAVMARSPLDLVRSHAALTPQDLELDLPSLPLDQPIFRRDVLEIRSGALTLFICHFKAPYPDTQRTWDIRRAEARALHEIIYRSQSPQALWLVLGDLNEPASDHAPRALEELSAISVDLLDRLPAPQRWTWHHPPSHLYGHPDAMLASPTLAHQFPNAVPQILREGMSLETHRNPGPHLSGVGHHRPHASDHAALVLDLPGL
ncbi:endonuclease/exonuclease/phosphatase family protein [Thalassovita sp.]|jgi:endonuclease/exonuclease/phosphatase family metal-dependent hydrolase|uniref:endonuclease/exonuclease/phosphatase family protein n=1 Tax=Thalassovita sp. TaxID=1979401 RepID=UPI003B59EC38